MRMDLHSTWGLFYLKFAAPIGGIRDELLVCLLITHSRFFKREQFQI